MACTRQNNVLLTVNFKRSCLQQTGDGHFSPVAAYNPNKNMVLLLQTAKFKYDSYWCNLDKLYEALKP